MRKEIWRSVKDYEGFYEVSSLGRVRSLTRSIPTNVAWHGESRVMRGRILKSGGKKYAVVNLSKAGKVRSVNVHFIVAQVFCKGEAPGLVVDHIDRNRRNNCADNLRWVTYGENHRNSIFYKGDVTK